LVQPVVKAIERFESAQKPFYLEVRSQGTHVDFQLFEEDERNIPNKHWTSRAKSIYYTDQYIGQVVRAIRESPRLSKLALLVIISSDHGENVAKPTIANYHIPFTILDINHRVFFKGHPTEINQTYANYDFPATILDLLGLPSLPGSIGRSMRSKNPEDNRFVYSIDGDIIIMQNSTHFVTVRHTRNYKITIVKKSDMGAQWKTRRLSAVYKLRDLPEDIQSAYWDWESLQRYCKSRIKI